MKPLVVLTQRVHADALDLLMTVCDVALASGNGIYARHDLKELARHAHGLVVGSAIRIDESLLSGCNHLQVVACTFRIPEHIDVAACTRRRAWVTNVMTRWLGKEAEIEAARNVLDVISGDTPRSALNDVLARAA
ncbi:MAG: hydroxyacid dehydrogenase [Betaproteobacteria bacterium]|nr:hydroxyacid dehydrogenase [Betaproteobacteria bacterium]